MNTRHRLSDGSGIYYTIARWYTPNGTLIEGSGIDPQIQVAADPEGQTDPQLQQALELLEEQVGPARRQQF